MWLTLSCAKPGPASPSDASAPTNSDFVPLSSAPSGMCLPEFPEQADRVNAVVAVAELAAANFHIALAFAAQRQARRHEEVQPAGECEAAVTLPHSHADSAGRSVGRGLGVVAAHLAIEREALGRRNRADQRQFARPDLDGLV